MYFKVPCFSDVLIHNLILITYIRLCGLFVTWRSDETVDICHVQYVLSIHVVNSGNIIMTLGLIMEAGVVIRQTYFWIYLITKGNLHECFETLLLSGVWWVYIYCGCVYLSSVTCGWCTLFAVVLCLSLLDQWRIVYVHLSRLCVTSQLSDV